MLNDNEKTIRDQADNTYIRSAYEKIYSLALEQVKDVGLLIQTFEAEKALVQNHPDDNDVAMKLAPLIKQ